MPICVLNSALIYFYLLNNRIKMNNNEELKIPEGCNFLLAREEIKNAFDFANKEANKKGEQIYFDPELVKAWNEFKDNPTEMTADALLQIAPMLQQYFKESSPGGTIYNYNTFKKG